MSNVATTTRSLVLWLLFLQKKHKELKKRSTNGKFPLDMDDDPMAGGLGGGDDDDDVARLAREMEEKYVNSQPTAFVIVCEYNSTCPLGVAGFRQCVLKGRQ